MTSRADLGVQIAQRATTLLHLLYLYFCLYFPLNCVLILNSFNLKTAYVRRIYLDGVFIFQVLKSTVLFLPYYLLVVL